MKSLLRSACTLRFVILSEAKDLLQTAFAALREIFDESAYARFLTRNRLLPSSHSYAAFVDERQGRRPRPRCC